MKFEPPFPRLFSQNQISSITPSLPALKKYRGAWFRVYCFDYNLKTCNSKQPTKNSQSYSGMDKLITLNLEL
jgi:hypothetical protein